jgi:hypothetical protein
MTNLPAINNGGSPKFAWGEANEKRGLEKFADAIAFVREFPITTILTNEQFDEWAQRQGLLNSPPPTALKRSDTWMAHLHRRHELRYRLNKAGSHPRLQENGATPFSMDSLGRGMYQVRAPHIAVAQSGLPRKVASLVKYKKIQLTYLMQSADWTQIPPHERAVAESIYDDIENFAALINLQADSLSNKLGKLRRRLEQIVPKMISEIPSEDEMDENDSSA